MRLKTLTRSSLMPKCAHTELGHHILLCDQRESLSLYVTTVCVWLFVLFCLWHERVCVCTIWMFSSLCLSACVCVCLSACARTSTREATTDMVYESQRMAWKTVRAKKKKSEHGAWKNICALCRVIVCILHNPLFGRSVFPSARNKQESSWIIELKHIGRIWMLLCFV